MKFTASSLLLVGVAGAAAAGGVDATDSDKAFLQSATKVRLSCFCPK